MPIFHTGERVVCEENPNMPGYPRWNVHMDNGPSGKFLSGRVDVITKTSIRTLLDNGITWDWPHIGSPDFDPNQWNRSGYLQPAAAAVTSFSTPMNIVINWSDIKWGEDGNSDWVIGTPQEAPVEQPKESKVQALQKRFIGKTNTEGCECGGWAIGAGHSSWCKCSQKRLYYNPLTDEVEYK